MDWCQNICSGSSSTGPPAQLRSRYAALIGVYIAALHPWLASELPGQHVHLPDDAVQAAANPEPVATLPEEECAALLQQLVSARAAAHAKLQSLPFVIETPSQARLWNAAGWALDTGGRCQSHRHVLCRCA